MKQIRKIQLILFLIIILCSCVQRDNHDLAGTWRHRDGFLELTLTLNPDSSYKQTVVGDMINSRSSGKWQINGENLVLNSDRIEPVDFFIKSSYDRSIKGIRFMIREDFGDPVACPRILMVTANSLMDTMFFDVDGIFSFSNIDSLRRFDIFYVGMKNVSWPVADTNNVFEITMMPNHDSYIYQNNVHWKIKENRIYFPTDGNNNERLSDKQQRDYLQKE